MVRYHNTAETVLISTRARNEENYDVIAGQETVEEYNGQWELLEKHQGIEIIDNLNFSFGFGQGASHGRSEYIGL